MHTTTLVGALAVLAVTLPQALGFHVPLPVGLRPSLARSAASRISMVASREGTGNRMTDGGFTTPFVVPVEAPYGTEYKIVDDLNPKKLSIQEKVKVAKPGLAIMAEIDALAAEAKEKGGAQFLDEDQINWRLKWMGLFHRAREAPGTFMWRLRVPNGICTSKQWRTVGEIISTYDNGSRDDWTVNGCGDVTTRQNLQLRGIRLEDLPQHWKALRDVGLFSVQSGMDNVRNLVGNPIAGIDPLEIVDTRKYCEDWTNKLTNNGNGNPEYTNLPRKFNVCFVGSNEMYEHPDINDIAYIPAKNDKGEMGWNIDVGGLLMSVRCEFAIPLDAWVPQDKYWPLGDAILTTFRDYGYRYNPRTKTRLMFLIDDMGIDLFREEVAKRYKASTGEDLPREGKSLVPKEWERRELIGVHKQKDGKNWVGVHVPAGRMYGDEMVAFADMADKYGAGEVRMMVEENVLLPHVADEHLEPLLAELKEKCPRWSVAPKTIQKGTVSCTGNQFCGLANINTKGNAIEIADRMDERFEFPKDVRIHWTGCTNTCGQVQIGDIGLLGTKGKDSEGNPTDCVDVYVGGGIGQTSAIGTVVEKGVTVDEQLEDVLAKILVEQFGAKQREGYVPTPKPKHPKVDK